LSALDAAGFATGRDRALDFGTEVVTVYQVTRRAAA
jgi:hypothetical protein